MNNSYKVFLFLGYILCFGFSKSVYGQSKKPTLGEELLKISPKSNWEMVDSVKLKFNAFHTQGMVKIGDHYYLSSVEIVQRTKRYQTRQNGYDRDEGKGVGHIFKIDKHGNLLKDIVVGEGGLYHPSGLDFDGQYIWFAVAEYRPDSQSMVCRLDVNTDSVEVLFRFDDHIGTLVKPTGNNKLIAASWGAEKFYELKLYKGGKGGVKNSRATINQFGYVAFQDSQYVGNHLMFGSGIRQYVHPKGAKYTLGGWELYNLRTMKPVWQLPVTLTSFTTGNSLVNNPCYIENSKEGILAYFAPDDDEKTVIYQYRIVD